MLVRRLTYFYSLKRNLSLPVERLEEAQRRKLAATVKYAYDNVPFYRRKFDTARVTPDHVRSVEELVKLPMIAKPEIQASSLSDVTARNVDVSKCVKETTSGSSGLPVTVYHDKRSEDFRYALLARAYWENGLRFWHRLAVILDPRILPRSKPFAQRLGISRKKHISIFDHVETQLAALEDFQPNVIKSYPSALEIMARTEPEKCRHVRPKLILTGSELLHKKDAELIRSVFECESVDDYGCFELGPLAWECREHMGYHMNIDGVIMEFVDSDGEPVAPGERGEIVCTSLVNYAMPLIRYRLGDQGIPMSEECSCGRSLPLMKMLEGRKDDFLTALDGRVISPLVFFPYPFESMAGISQFRVIQEKRNRIVIQLVATQDFFNDHRILERASREIGRVFGEGMDVDFQRMEKIERDSSGKIRKIISRVPVKWNSQN